MKKPYKNILILSGLALQIFRITYRVLNISKNINLEKIGNRLGKYF